MRLVAIALICLTLAAGTEAVPAHGSEAGLDTPLVFVWDRGEIRFIPPEGWAETPTFVAHGVQPSLQGGVIAYTADPFNRADIHTVRVDGTDPRVIYTTGFSSRPALSYDGQKLAWRQGNDIFLSEADGSSVRNLTGGSGRWSSPAFDPSGVELFAIGVSAAGDGAAVIDVTTGQVTFLNRPGAVLAGTFEPDGSLLYVRSLDGLQELVRFDSDTGAETMLMSTPGYIDSPTVCRRNGAPVVVVESNGAIKDTTGTTLVRNGSQPACELRLPFADLQTTIAAPAETVQGMRESFVVRVRNQGPEPAMSAVVDIELPDGFIARTGSGRCGNPATPVVHCQLGTIARGAALSVQLDATATGDGIAYLRAVASSSTPDSDVGSNRAVQAINVASPTDFAERFDPQSPYECVVTAKITAGEAFPPGTISLRTTVFDGSVTTKDHQVPATGKLDPQVIFGPVAVRDPLAWNISSSFDGRPDLAEQGTLPCPGEQTVYLPAVPEDYPYLFYYVVEVLIENEPL